MKQEIWDLYCPDGTPAGREMVRGESIPAGLCHLVCEVLVRHTDGDYLLMRRSLTKDLFPGYWEATAGGSALKGEDALACVRRELREETGIEGESFEQIFRKVIRGNTIFCTWLCVTDWDKTAITLQEGETDAFRWVTEAEFIDFINGGGIINIQRHRWVDWYRKMGYME
ncbi:MAG: NUDIX domain-containing protein [Oscillospiraceae bacterium]|nr:NUDIX domain-containing protein [Oscillospiraceae bacterium]